MVRIRNNNKRYYSGTSHNRYEFVILLWLVAVLRNAVGFVVTTTITTATTDPAVSFGRLFGGFPHSSSQHTTTTLYGRNRGLEIPMESATPTEGGMTLYIKAGPLDNDTEEASIGDCPFAHYVRMVLSEKNLSYTIRPCTADTKPSWLIDYYQGQLPALRHSSECYTESDVICEYLDFFFTTPPLKSSDKKDKSRYRHAKETSSTLFPALAKYLKHTPDGDEKDGKLRENLETVLQSLEELLQEEEESLFLAGSQLTLLDCALAPKLFHLKVGVKHFKNNAIDFGTKYPTLGKYMDAMFARPSFVESSYPEETVVWGWSNARS